MGNRCNCSNPHLHPRMISRQRKAHHRFGYVGVFRPRTLRYMCPSHPKKARAHPLQQLLHNEKNKPVVTTNGYTCIYVYTPTLCLLYDLVWYIESNYFKLRHGQKTTVICVVTFYSVAANTKRRWRTILTCRKSKSTMSQETWNKSWADVMKWRW